MGGGAPLPLRLGDTGACKGWGGGGGRDASEGKGSPRRSQKRLDIVGGGCQSGWGRLLSVTNAPLKHFGPLKGVGGHGGRGGSQFGVPCTLTYIPQNDPVVAMIILE